jgi:hypothetical protein
MVNGQTAVDSERLERLFVRLGEPRAAAFVHLWKKSFLK